MYEIQMPLFPLLFFHFHNIKKKSFDELNDKYSFEFMTLSYMKNQDIMIFLELHKIFPQLISKNNDFIIDEDKKLLGVFSYSYNNKTMRLMIIIQEANKNINFRCKMKKKTYTNGERERERCGYLKTTKL